MGDRADRGDARDVHVRQVARDAEADRRGGDGGGPEPIAHEATAALIAAGRAAASTAFSDDPCPTRNVGVESTPELTARVSARLSRAVRAAPSRAAKARFTSRPGTAAASRRSSASVAQP